MIRVLIADDHSMVRDGLRRIIEEHGDMEVVAEAADGDEVLTRCGETSADVIVLDLAMPGPGFLRVMERLREDHPLGRVLVLSAHPEDQYAVRALKLGAAGYLTKHHSPGELADAIRRVHSGGRFVTAALAEKLAFDLGPDATPEPHHALSTREYEVLCLLGAGKSIKEIAAQMRVSSKTVSTYRARLLEKLGVKTTADLIRYAIGHDLTP